MKRACQRAAAAWKRSSSDVFALADGQRARAFVLVAAGDDSRRIRDDGAVVEKHVDVVLRRQQRADVALQNEVRTVGAFDRFGNLVVGRVDEIANLAADGLLPIGQGIDLGVNTRIGSVGHAGSTVT